MRPHNRFWTLREVTSELWCKAAADVRFGNLMQSWEYGLAKSEDGWGAHHFLIFDEDGMEAGLVQVLCKRVLPVGAIARINRGPVFFDKWLSINASEPDVTAIWTAINKLAIRKLWWLMSCAPERINEQVDGPGLTKAGLMKREGNAAWGSFKLSLLPEKDDLFTALNGKWRNLLRKGLKQESAVEEVVDVTQVESLLSEYEAFQSEKSFHGVPTDVLKHLLGLKGGDKIAKMYRTVCDNTSKTTGFVVITHHFDSAMYLVGWTSSEGRSQQSNYVLLWHAINEAKQCGLDWFDMGGVTENTPKGIAHFKKGVNGIFYENCGEYISIPMLYKIVPLFYWWK